MMGHPQRGDLRRQCFMRKVAYIVKLQSESADLNWPLHWEQNFLLLLFIKVKSKNVAL
jgi:hypothetical protein